MGQKIDRIETEFLLNSLIEKRIPLSLHGFKTEQEGYLLSYSNKILKLEIPDTETFNEKEEVRVFFFFFNKAHTFNAVVKSKGKNTIELLSPEGVYKSLQRKHERVKSPEDIEVYFVHEGRSIELNFPKTNYYVPLEKLDDSITSSIEQLYREFSKKMENVVSEARIAMMRNKTIDTIEEFLVHESSKSLWIPSTLEDLPLINPFPEDRIITRGEVVGFLKKRGSTKENPKHEIEKMLFEKQKNNIFSELYTPILYNQYFVGYVYIMNSFEKNKQIDEDLVEEIYHFSKILCYTLEYNNYFISNKKVESRYDAHIIDISASGILFALPDDDELNKDILVYSDIELCFIIKKRKMTIGSRVIRKSEDKNKIYLALQYQNIKPEDYRFIYEYLYGKHLNDTNDVHWEGGASPPEFSLG